MGVGRERRAGSMGVGSEGSQLLVAPERVLRNYYDFCNQDWVMYGLAPGDLSLQSALVILSLAPPRFSLTHTGHSAHHATTLKEKLAECSIKPGW